MKRAASKSSAPVAVVAELCLYGTRQTGAGWLARVLGGSLLGSGEPVAGRDFTTAIFGALEELADAGVREGLVAIFDAGGERWAVLPLGDVPTYGAIAWRAAPVVTISAAALLAAAAQ